jgi:hypothetical protein
MMAATVLSRVAADGVTLILTPAGTIKARGTETAVKHWLPVIRANKATLLEALNDHQSRKLNQTAKPDRLPAEDQGRQDRTHSANPNTGDARSADAAGTHTQASAQGLVEERLSDPDTTCPACGSGQYWQLPGEPWHCWQCEPDMPLTAKTLTLPCNAVCKEPALDDAWLRAPSKTVNPAGEARRREVLAMLTERPTIIYAITTDDECDSEFVIMTLAIRNKATAELRIPRAKYDGLALLDLVKQQTSAELPRFC